MLNDQGDMVIHHYRIGDIRRLQEGNESIFIEFSNGLYISNWNASNCGGLKDFLQYFQNIRKLEIKINWDTGRNEEQILNDIENAVSRYEYLGELSLDNCRLSNERLISILNRLPNRRNLRILNVQSNFFRNGIIQSVRTLLPELLTLGIEEGEYPARIINWDIPSSHYENYYKALLGNKKAYKKLMRSRDTSPLSLSYRSIFSYIRGGEIIQTAGNLNAAVNIESLERMAIEGNVEAQNNYAMILFFNNVASGGEGRLTQRDPEMQQRAYCWLRKSILGSFSEAAVGMGYSEAAVNMGYIAYHIYHDELEAIKYYELAVSRINAHASYRLAQIYIDRIRRGIDVENSTRNLGANLNAATMRGHVRATSEFSRLLLAVDKKNPSAIVWLRQAAREGDRDAIQELKNYELLRSLYYEFII